MSNVILIDEAVLADGRKMVVHKVLEKDNFQIMYDPLGDLEHLWMPESASETFCAEHRDKLREDALTFFLHKKNEAKPATKDNLFISSAYISHDGQRINVCRFENVYVRFPGLHLRLVSPKLGD